MMRDPSKGSWKHLVRRFIYGKDLIEIIR